MKEFKKYYLNYNQDKVAFRIKDFVEIRSNSFELCAESGFKFILTIEEARKLAELINSIDG